MFHGCSSLVTLPDISKWNIINVTCKTYMFADYYSIESFPDISKWNISKLAYIEGIFDRCKFSLKNLFKFINNN